LREEVRTRSEIHEMLKNRKNSGTTMQARVQFFSVDRPTIAGYKNLLFSK